MIRTFNTLSQKECSNTVPNIHSVYLIPQQNYLFYKIIFLFNLHNFDQMFFEMTPIFL